MRLLTPQDGHHSIMYPLQDFVIFVTYLPSITKPFRFTCWKNSTRCAHFAAWPGWQARAESSQATARQKGGQTRRGARAGCCTSAPHIYAPQSHNFITRLCFEAEVARNSFLKNNSQSHFPHMVQQHSCLNLEAEKACVKLL